MAAYWSSFADSSLASAADFAGDMMPVLGVLAGIALAAGIITFVLRQVRG